MHSSSSSMLGLKPCIDRYSSNIPCWLFREGQVGRREGTPTRLNGRRESLHVLGGSKWCLQWKHGGVGRSYHHRECITAAVFACMISLSDLLVIFFDSFSWGRFHSTHTKTWTGAPYCSYSKNYGHLVCTGKATFVSKAALFYSTKYSEVIVSR